VDDGSMDTTFDILERWAGEDAKFRGLPLRGPGR